MKKNIFFTAVPMILVSILLTGCGKKGLPLPPEGSRYDYPKPYPSE